MPSDPVQLTMVFRPDDFEPAHGARLAARFTTVADAAATRAGIGFRFVPAHALVPICLDRPQLWHQGENLLLTRQCFQVDEFSPDPQTAAHLDAIARTIGHSDSVLLNHSFTGPGHVTVDKLSIVQHAARLGLPVAPTVAVPFGRYVRTVLPLVDLLLGDGPYMLKPRQLGMGVAAVKIATREELAAAIDVVAQSGLGYLVQRFLPNTGDLRVFVVDGAPVATQHRRPPPGGYLANTSQDGTCAPGRDVEEVIAASMRVVESLSASCLQVDWLLTDHGPVLSEWGGGFGGFSALTEPDRTRVADAFMAWVRHAYDTGTPRTGTPARSR